MDLIENINITKFCNDSNIKFKIGAEIEFYLEDFSQEKYDLFKTKLLKNRNYIELEKEDGQNQYEVKILYNDRIYIIVNRIITIRKVISEIAESFSMKAIFSPKPYLDQPGSALHIHISIYSNGKNLFAKNNEKESDYLIHAIGGLCSTMKKFMINFIPSHEGYKRLVAKSNAPTTISWGANNRTVAVRVPTTDELNRRIEHRISSSDADPKKVIDSIIYGICTGIENKIKPPPKIYGDGSDQQYDLEKLPTTYEEAELFSRN